MKFSHFKILFLLFTSSLFAQKNIQQKHFLIDFGLNYTGALNYATSKILHPKVGYTTNFFFEKQYNNGRIFRTGLGHSLNGFAYDSRFLNILHTYNLNQYLLYGKVLKNKDRFYIGQVGSYALRIFNSELLNIRPPSKFDVKLHLSYCKRINRVLGIDFTAQLGGINVDLFSNGYMHHWELSSKMYVKFLTKKNEAFIAN